MNSQGEVDVDGVKILVEFHIAAGTPGIVPVVTTVEAATLSIEANVKTILKTVEFADGRIPVIAGAGANATSEEITMTKWVKASGGAGCLSVGPYYKKPPPEGMYKPFKTRAKRTELPKILYNVPGRPGHVWWPEPLG
ncbi:dihydrodipicolinate synthase family protein, partial [[Pasteurella] aerogenes]